VPIDPVGRNEPKGHIMKTWLKRTLIGVAATAALAGSIAAYSQGEAHFHGGPPSAADMAAHEASMLEHVGKSLNLDASQKAKLKALADQLHAQHDAFMKNGGDPHERMKALIAGNTFDRAGAQALVNDKVAQIQASSPALINAAGDFYDSLDATQQQKARDFMARMHAHHGPMGMHHEHGAPSAAG
jgi:Spy/CpxP family protein refolding chaperone